MRHVLLASLACAAIAEERSLKGYHLFSLKSEDERVAEVLRAQQASPTVAGIDFWTEPRRGRVSEVQVSVPPASVGDLKAFLTANNVTYNILDDDILPEFEAQVSDRTPYVKGNLASFDYYVYHTYTEIMDWIRDIHAAYPDISEVVHIGWSYENREIVGLRIFTNSSTPNKKKIFTNYCIHSREWLSPATGVYLAGRFLTEYNSSAEIRHLVNSIDFTFVPVSNPDGYVFTWSSLLNRLWRKTRAPNPGSTCIGTDPNRNWAFAWGGPGASADPCNDAYFGSGPFSAIETRSISNYLAANGPFQGFIDVHCCGNMWMTPWGYTYSYPPYPDYQYQMEQNVQSTSALRSVRGTQYAYGTIADVVYQASGSTVDWTYGDQGVLYSVAVELSGNFVSPASIIAETVPEVFAAFREFCFVVLNHDSRKF